jgi:Uma2 family endonuclease
MSAVPKPKMTFEEYLARERLAAGKSEFYRGEVFAMAGGSPRHNAISVNLVACLRTRLRGSPCRPYNSDQRIRIPSNGLATYPDVSVICGDLKLDEQDRDAIVNASVILEVLSKSTESYDRGKKFDLYRELDSFREYILVSQDEPQIERFVRQEDGSWLLTVVKGAEAELRIQTLSCVLPLSEVYEDVKFGPEDGN